MATYVNDLRLKEISTGDESGTWGTSTNTNLELIGEALGYATQQVFSSDADATTTVADGASDPARAMYFKITSAGSLTATRTCTIAPNTVSRVMFIENATSGSQSIAISQGSGANVTIATGKTAVVYLDGAGSGAAVVDAMAGVDPGVTDTLAEVLVAGNATGGTDIAVGTGDDITFADNSKAIFGAGSDLQIYSDGTTGQVTGNVNVTGSVTAGAATFSGDVNIDKASPLLIFKESAAAKLFIGESSVVGGGAGFYDFYAVTGLGQRFFTNSIQRMTISSAGNVGIGGTPIVYPLEVFGGNGDGLVFKESLNSVTNWFGAFNASAVVGSLTNHPLAFYTNATERMRIDTSGNLLVGKTAVDFSIDGVAAQPSGVVGVTRNGGAPLILNRKTSDGDIAIFQKDGAPVGSIGTDTSRFKVKSNSLALYLENESGKQLVWGNVSSVPYFYPQSDNDTNIGYPTQRFKDLYLSGGALTSTVKFLANTTVSGSDATIFRPADNTMAFSTNGAERLRIDSAGNVGIGSSSALTSTYLSKAFVYTAGGANFAIGGSSNTNDAVLSRFTSFNISNSNSGNQDSANFYGVTSIESIVVTTDNNAGDDSGGSLLFKTKPEAGALTERMRIGSDGQLTSSVAGGVFKTRADGGGLEYTQLLDVATAGCTIFGKSNRGDVASISLYQTATGADGGYIRFSTSNSGSTTPTEKVRIDSSGNVGIGTATLNGLKTVIKGSTGYPATTGTTQTGVLRLTGGAGLYNVLDMGVNESTDSSWIQSTRANSLGTYDNLLLNPYGGNVGIGTSTPTSYASNCLHLNGASSSISLRLTNSTTGSTVSDGSDIEVDGSNLNIVNRESGNIALYTSATERMRIDASGNVGIGLDGGYKLDVLTTTGNVVSARFTTTATSATEYGAIIVLTNDPNDTTRYFLEGEGGGNTRFRIYSNGNMVNQNNSYTGISDEKLKENIVDAGSQWDDIKALRVRKYSFKEENASEPTQIGVIAQEVEAAGMSGLVYETADQDTAEDGSFVDTGEVTKTMKYSILYMKAVKALQEAMDRIETLEAKVAALES